MAVLVVVAVACRSGRLVAVVVAREGQVKLLPDPERESLELTLRPGLKPPRGLFAGFAFFTFFLAPVQRDEPCYGASPSLSFFRVEASFFRSAEFVAVGVECGEVATRRSPRSAGAVATTAAAAGDDACRRAGRIFVLVVEQLLLLHSPRHLVPHSPPKLRAPARDGTPAPGAKRWESCCSFSSLSSWWFPQGRLT